MSHPDSSFCLLPRYLAPSSWWEHVPLAHWLIARIQPTTVVELGSQYGVSFFAFCEAAEAFSQHSFIYAVDTWHGDEQAGAYGDEVYAQVLVEQQERHLSRSRLVRSSFDEAATHFPPNSIDVLHIDGLHTYEAVKHDFQTWLPMVRAGGVILFHDINVREADFGVWQLWDEVVAKPTYQTISFANGHGLGILCLDTQTPGWFAELEEQRAALVAKGSLLAQISGLRPECQWDHRDHRPFKDQLEDALQKLRGSELKCSHQEQERAILLDSIQQLQNELTQLQNELIQLHQSSSWTFTAPFRRIASLFSR